MFGGKLNKNNIEILNHKNCLLTVFSNSLYFFDINQTHILNKIQLSDSLIVSWIFIEKQNKILAIDSEGNLIELTFVNFKKNQNTWYQNENVKKTNKKIGKLVKDAKIVYNTYSNTTMIYYIQQNDLYQYINGTKNIFTKSVSKIFYASQSHIICGELNNNKSIKIINLQKKKNIQKQIIFQHSTQITSALVQDNSLITGDIKGKIFVFKNFIQNKGKSTLATKLQWHVHQINSLFLDGQYLYSCGQQGTIVMWHLRQNNRDFLPRIGCQIKNIFVKEGVIYSLLNDNSITSIDLNNDKLLKSYKTVINPFGFLTKSTKDNNFDEKRIIFKSSQNNRNLLLGSGLAGSLQLINLNDGSNNQISVLPRNLISRLDDNYPQPHDICNVSLNKQWTLLCCSTFGINHNYLHFYKNQGFNSQFNLISKVQNPHIDKINILNYNNLFITYSKLDKSVRFWSKVRKNKKSIIQKEQEYFTCSGQITYREKQVISCSILAQQNLLLINYQDQIVIIDLKEHIIKTAFKVKGIIQKAEILKVGKTNLKLIIVTDKKISVFDLNKASFELTNCHVIYSFEKIQRKKIQLAHLSSGNNLGVLINYVQKQVIFQYDLTKHSILNSFQNQNSQQISIVSICYKNHKLFTFSSDSSVMNITNTQQIIKLESKKSISSLGLQNEQTVGQIQEQQKFFDYLNKNFIQRANIRNKSQVIECLQKIQLQMYPNLSFGFNSLCQKMFY